MESRKYGRTYHFPFSPGTTSDDRIQYDYWQYVLQMHLLVHTEKLDGENNCLSRYGVFARSHAAPATSPWTQALRARWEWMKHDLGDLELFGENLYAVHSIEYSRLEEHFFLFAVRCLDQWLSWEEVCFYAAVFDLPVVPVLAISPPPVEDGIFREELLKMTQLESRFGSVDMLTQQRCTLEGVVSRNAGEYAVDQLGNNVFKYVRKGHVKTDEHWTRNWKRARLICEIKKQQS